MSFLVLATMPVLRVGDVEIDARRHVERRTVQVPVVRVKGGNGANYYLKLPNDELSIMDIDGNGGFGVRDNRHLEIRLLKDEEGLPRECSITLGKVRYADLNGDGVLDIMGDARGGRSTLSIFFEGCFVKVRPTKTGLGTRNARALDGSIHYVFKQGRWIVKLREPERGGYAPWFGPGIRSLPLPWSPPPKRNRGEQGAEQHGQHKLSEPERDRLIRRCRQVIGAVPLNGSRARYLELVAPQPDSAFTRFGGEKLSADLVRLSMGWMNQFFKPEANPYRNMVTVVVAPPEPPPNAPSLPGTYSDAPAAPFFYLSTPEWERFQDKIRKAWAEAPRLPRSSPKKYYLGTGGQGDKSLLLYEFESQSGKYGLTVMESNAALLVRIQPRQPELDLSKGIPRDRLQRILREVLSDKAFAANSDKQPFDLPAHVESGTAFSNTADFPLVKHLDNRFSSPGDWSEQVVGFVSEKGIWLVLIKSRVVHEAAERAPPGSDWDPDWLRDHLYQSDAKTLVIEAKGAKQVQPPGAKPKPCSSEDPERSPMKW